MRGTLDRAQYMLSIAQTALADVGLEDTDKPGFKRFIRRAPLGVVLVIAPWKLVLPFVVLDLNNHSLASLTWSRSTLSSRRSSQEMP